MGKWRDLLKKENQYAEAKAEHKFNEKADPKIQVEQAIAELQRRHDDLAEQAARVMANHKQAQMRLTRALEQQSRLTQSAQSALDAGHEDAAKTFATQLVSVNQQVDDLKAMVEQTQTAAEQAKQAVVENGEMLQAKMAESQHILAEVDQARMTQDVADTMKQVTSMSNQAIPSFDEIRDKVEGQYAKAQSDTELESANPEMMALHAHHEEIQDQASALLEQMKSKSKALPK